MKTLNQQTGMRGEELAKQYLESLNFTILETNWKTHHLEVDLIAQNQNNIIFCEVKTRSSTKMGAPESFVTSQKQRNLIKAAHQYVTQKNINKEVRFAIIGVVFKGDEFDIEHIIDAFTPKW